MGRAEGQADLLLSIIQALEEAGFEGGFGKAEQKQQRLQNLRAIVWTKVAQALDTAAEEEKKSTTQNRLPPTIQDKQKLRDNSE